MRVRIVKQPTGTVDGIELWKLIEGHTYDMGASLATFLIVSQWAEPVADEAPALVVPLDHPRIVEVVNPPSRSTADDRPRRRRQSRRTEPI